MKELIYKAKKFYQRTDQYEMIDLLFETAEELLAKQSVNNENLTGIGISCGGPLSSKPGIPLRQTF